MPSVLRSTRAAALALITTACLSLFGCASPAAAPSSYPSAEAKPAAEAAAASEPAEPAASTHVDRAPSDASRETAKPAEERDGLRKASRPPLEWHKIQFVPGKQDADRVSLTLTGKDKGIAPMPRVPSALDVELPNDYSIVIKDPEYGPMMYDAKIGLLEPER